MMFNIEDMDLLAVPKIKVFGIGDFGARVIKSVQKTELPHVQCFSVQSGEMLEEASILDKLRGGDLEFLVADMEEDAVVQTASMLARCAKKIGVPAVGWMRGRVLDKTEGGYSRFEELKNSMVSVIVVPGNVTDAETIIAMGIKGIGSIVGTSGNLDFSDVEPIFSHGGLGIIALGEAEGEQATDAVRKAVASFPAGISLDGAKSVLLIYVTPIGQGLGIEECNAAMLELQKSLHAEANTIMSNYQEKGADGSIKAMIIATNFE